MILTIYSKQRIKHFFFFNNNNSNNIFKKPQTNNSNNKINVKIFPNTKTKAQPTLNSVYNPKPK